MSDDTPDPADDPTTISAPLEPTTGLHLVGPLDPASAPLARAERVAALSDGHPRLIRELYAYRQQRIASRRQSLPPAGPS